VLVRSAKGLEFPHVFVVGFEEELIPHATSIQEDNIEEERRLAYVGITRAEKSLTMTMARSRKRYGEKIVCEPSRFIEELPEDDTEWMGGGNASKEKDSQDKGKETSGWSEGIAGLIDVKEKTYRRGAEFFYFLRLRRSK